MHIQEAKKQIRNAVIACTAKDERGRLKIPVVAQRPVFLIGAPGIGKTAIVEQIAKELNIGFVSYSMTHHTRQSALGLPFIIEREFGGKKYSVSEYTMSEIIASVYEEMERTQKNEGILFLDEINCVSETLAPSMLQFLQYKTFGRHKVPEGWIIVTAGNPAEYNDSVREFDIAMLDRLKKIEVEPDYEIWKEYAAASGVHAVILSYLGIKPQNFYRVQATVDGKNFVTARGWDDLGKMISLYEENSLPVDYSLIGQYVQDEEIAKDFANYYDLYRKYRSDYQIGDILEGKDLPVIVGRAKKASFDERLSLISLILSSLQERTSIALSHENCLKTVIGEIRMMKDPDTEKISERISFYKKKSQETDTEEHVSLAFDNMEFYQNALSEMRRSDEPKEALKALLKKELNQFNEENEKAQNALNNAFRFLETCYGNGQEMVIAVSEMTIRPSVSKYIFRHGCEKYYQYNDQLLFENRRDELAERINALNLNELEISSEI